MPQRMKIKLKRLTGRPRGNKPASVNPDFYKLPDLCVITGLLRNTIIKLRANGMPCVKIGRTFYFHRPTVIAWINEHMRAN